MLGWCPPASSLQVPSEFTTAPPPLSAFPDLSSVVPHSTSPLSSISRNITFTPVTCRPFVTLSFAWSGQLAIRVCVSGEGGFLISFILCSVEIEKPLSFPDLKTLRTFLDVVESVMQAEEEAAGSYSNTDGYLDMGDLKECVRAIRTTLSTIDAAVWEAGPA